MVWVEQGVLIKDAANGGARSTRKRESVQLEGLEDAKQETMVYDATGPDMEVAQGGGGGKEAQPLGLVGDNDGAGVPGQEAEVVRGELRAVAKVVAGDPAGGDEVDGDVAGGGREEARPRVEVGEDGGAVRGGVVNAVREGVQHGLARGGAGVREAQRGVGVRALREVGRDVRQDGVRQLLERGGGAVRGRHCGAARAWRRD